MRRKLPHPGRMGAAFDYAAAVLADEEVPHNAADTALCGVLAWLQHDGIGFAVYGGVNLMRQIRKLITADMAADWSSAMLAQRLNCSERVAAAVGAAGHEFPYAADGCTHDACADAVAGYAMVGSADCRRGWL